jgi:putative phosphoribosyl transferase
MMQAAPWPSRTPQAVDVMSTISSTLPQDVSVTIGPVTLRGLLRCPLNPVGIVLFAYGSGSSRLSPRNTYVAERLGGNGLATLLVDLLTEREEAADELTAQLRFDTPLLTSRLVVATEWTMKQPLLGDLPLGYFGASTGAALAAAARIPSISAVVSRGGRRTLPAPTSPRCAPQRFSSWVAMTARYWCSTARRSNE